MYICYSIQFYLKNNKIKNKNISTLISLDNKVNIIYLIYTTKLDFYTRKIYVSMQQINKFYLYLFEIVIVDCLIKNKLEKVQFF